MKHVHLTSALEAACPVCNPGKTVPQLNEAYRTSKDVALSLREMADKLPKQPVHLGLLQQALRGGAADIEQLCAQVGRLKAEINRLRPMAESWESYVAAEERKAAMRSDETTAEPVAWTVEASHDGSLCQPFLLRQDACTYANTKAPQHPGISWAVVPLYRSSVEPT